jgi:predicted aminopeptidase
VRALILAIVGLLSQSCFSAGYLVQAAKGQYGILRAARPIGEVVTDEDTPERTRRLLAAVRSIKEYGQSQGLRPTTSYGRYAELGRPAAAWVVQGCAPLSFEVRRWDFPVVGTVPYLGFFDESDARRYARELSVKEALDVDVRTASAFSTLGWFHDPVLSTMIRGGEEALGELANVILHESVHATLYVPDQSAFNESLASFVADRLTLPWLVSVLGREAPETTAWTAMQLRERRRVARLHRAYRELDDVYRSRRSDAEKLAEKARLLRLAQDELRLARPLNNAVLAGYRTYDLGTPAFEKLLAACGGSWPRLLGAVRRLTSADFGSPQREEFEPVVLRLAQDGCAG